MGSDKGRFGAGRSLRRKQYAQVRCLIASMIPFKGAPVIPLEAAQREGDGESHWDGYDLLEDPEKRLEP